MHDIVVAVDASESSRRAVEFAAGWVRDGLAGSVLLLHVVKWSPFSFNTPSDNENRHRQREREVESARATILDPLLAQAGEHEVKADSMVRHGDPAHVIAAIAKAESARAVVIGRTGDSNLRERIFGGVASHVVQYSPVPVVVIP